MKKIFTLFIMLFGLMSSIVAKEITIYFINNVYWENINAYVWSDKTGEVLPWPGEPVKDTGLTCPLLLGNKEYGYKEYEYKIYSYTFDYNKAQNIIFNYKSEYDSKYYQTEDLKVNPEMSLIYNLKWFDGITYEYNSDKTAKVVDFVYDYNRNLEELSEILPNITSIEIPTTVQHNDTTYNVTSIGEEAFIGCSGLTSITIPNSVTSIGYDAFHNTGIYNDESNWENGLLYIEDCLVDADSNIEGTCSIKEGTRIIADDVFSTCYDLTAVTIPNSVTSIGEEAFSRCRGLTSITIPNSVTSLGSHLFDYCYKLTSVVWNAKNCSDYNSSFSPIGSQITSFTFGNEVEYIPKSLCYGMSKLTEMTIPNSVTSIGESTFYGCSGLTSVTIPNSVTSIGDYAFKSCSGLTSITIPNSVIYIGDGAFISCSGLTSIAIPNSVTSIGESAFSSCSGLTSITIPNNVTSIGESTFYGCSGLTSITIPNSVTSIGEEAFSSCSSLTSVTIPNSVTSIGEDAFYDTGIYNNNSNWDNGVLYIDNCLIEAKSDVVKGSYTIKEGTRIIGPSAFYGCSGLTEVTIPNSVTSIGKEAFYGCSGLTEVTIPNSVTSIGEKAFDNCSLKEITVLPTTVPKVDESAFGFLVVTFYITLYVPCDAYDEYVKNNVFGKFDNIKCISNDKPEENPTSIYETIIDANITISGGTISADTEFHIYNSIGQDVTSLNGNLVPGIYLVQIGEDRVKVMLK